MRIETYEDIARVYTPYNIEFVKRAKGIGGAHWNGEAWEVPARSVETVRTILKEVYGETDLISGEKVAVKLTFTDRYWTRKEPITIFGKTIAVAFSKDSGARVGDEVAFTKEQPKSGGSIRNWHTEIPKGAECIVYNVPKVMLDREVPEMVEFEIAEPKISKEELEEEREILLERLGKIEDLLAQEE